MSVFASEELQNHTEGEAEVKEKEVAEAEEEMERWREVYGSYGLIKPRQFIGSISDIMKKLPQGLQISRVGQHAYDINIMGPHIIYVKYTCCKHTPCSACVSLYTCIKSLRIIIAFFNVTTLYLISGT